MSQASHADTSASIAKVERTELCDLLSQVGPGAPTLCQGWSTFHLAAHLRMRESHPLDAVKAVAPRLSEKAIAEVVAQGDYARVVDDLRRGPSGASIFRFGKADELGNALEFFVHHEDVRRATTGWSPRDLPRRVENELWGRVAKMGRVLLRKAPVGVVLKRSDTGRSQAVVSGPDVVTVTGLPSELCLFAFGRGAVAQVDFDGDDFAVSRLRSTSFGI